MSLRKKKPRRDSGTPLDLERRIAIHTRKDETGCWIWTASRDREGYGDFNSGGLRTKAHRAAWIAKNGPIPDGMSVLHKCDVRHCVNPAHLFLGTQKDNIDDMIAKGRRRVLIDTSVLGRPGERHHAVKLTAKQIREICADKRSSIEAAKAYGVTDRTVRKIRQGKSWKHIPRNAVRKGPARDEKHLAKVRQEPCIACNASLARTEAHHVRCLGPRTMGVRKSDYLTVPLCQLCHRELHGTNEGEFWTEAKRFGNLADPAAWIAGFSEEGRKAIAELWGGI